MLMVEGCTALGRASKYMYDLFKRVQLAGEITKYEGA